LIISGLFNTTYQTVVRFGLLKGNSACCCSEAAVCSCACTGGCCSPVIAAVSYSDCDMPEIETIPSATFEFVKNNLKTILEFPEKVSYMNERFLIIPINFIFPIEKPPQISRLIYSI
jgi:hypothetical protein